MVTSRTSRTNSIAVVGMAGRFPGASSVAQLWELLSNGREAVVFPSEEELRAAGVSEELLRDPNYVKAFTPFEGADTFDARFFGCSPRQAASLDPHQRLFLECAWEALESAVCDPQTFGGSIAVFAGASPNWYYYSNVRGLTQWNGGDAFQTTLDAEKDYLATRTSFKLGLSGPSVTVQTACSTSLTAVHLACRCLQNSECDLALAGGVSLQAEQGRGYLYAPGGIHSPDGHCRAFDADAAGMIAGSGVGVVVLKRLADALRDGDRIEAVIRGSAINNDGARKPSFTAPSVQGQVEVITAALSAAGLEATDIGMMEAHGTGTALGDSIELTALAEVLRGRRPANGVCRLGSLKTNVGHLDAAAGVASLIKVVLSLKHRAFVPSLNVRKPNELLRDAHSPLRISTRCEPWQTATGLPRYAAVSAFGVGGTNAHVVLEEAPEPRSAQPTKDAQIFPLSALDGAALDRVSDRLAAYVHSNPGVELADIASTLQTGRKRFSHRRVVVACSADDLLVQLRERNEPVICPTGASSATPVVFMFPGQGAQRAGILRGLYETDALFSADVDRCAEVFLSELGQDVRDTLCGTGNATDISNTELAQPLLFTSGYCLAQLWLRWGVRPTAMIGHSLGEYVAACVAQACSLDAAAALVAARARMLGALPPGAMVAVQTSADQARELLTNAVSLAAVNGPNQCVFSGSPAAIASFMDQLARRALGFRRLAVSHAFHSPMMAPAAAALTEAAARIQFATPQLPYVSCVSGEFVTAADLSDRNYFAEHLQRPVQFAKGLARVAHPQGTVFLEVGSEQSLIACARQQFGRGSTFLSTLAGEQIQTRQDLLSKLGAIWMHGAQVDWCSLHGRQVRRRLELPTYPFERQRHWVVDTEVARAATTARSDTRLPPDEWFYIPSWRASLKPALAIEVPRASAWLLLAADGPLDAALEARLRSRADRVIVVLPGERYEELGSDRYRINPLSAENYERLCLELRRRHGAIGRIVHCWSLLQSSSGAPSVARFEQLQGRGYLSILHLAKSYCRGQSDAAVGLLIVTGGLQAVTTQPASCPEQAPLLGLCKVLPQELPGLRCTVLDLSIVQSAGGEDERNADWVVAEALKERNDPIVAVRNGKRFVLGYERVDLRSVGAPVRELRKGGVYAITGGTGNFGSTLAEFLVRTYEAHVVLIARGVQSRPRSIPQSSVCVQLADVSDEAQLRAAIAAGEARFGTLNGVFHLAAATAHPSLRRPLHELGEDDFHAQVRPKVHGFYALNAVLRGKPLDFAVAFSSNAATLGGPGFGAYAAANTFLDSAAASDVEPHGTQWIAVDWDGLRPQEAADGDPFSLSPSEALGALEKIVRFATVAQVIVSAVELERRVKAWLSLDRVPPLTPPVPAAGLRPAGAHAAKRIGPRTDLERRIARVWEEMLGVAGIGIEDDFFELGGDSLVALRVLAKLQEQFKVRLPVHLLIGSSTTIESFSRKLVAHLAAQRDGQRSAEQLRSGVG